MATSYTSLLGLALPVTGELQGTWGDTVNNAITSLLDTAVAGTTTLNTDADVTLTTTTGASNQARQAIILWTANGTTTRNITAPAQSKIYTVINASAGTQSIVIRGVGPTTGVTIVKGESALVAWNGSDFIKISNTSGAGSFTNLAVSGDLTLSGGTANGVLYLNGSKVATSGSALTFNGTNTFTVIPATGTAYNRTESTQYSTWLQAGAGNANVFWEFSAGTPVRWVDTSSGELMRLTSTGLGIGTSSPATKLQVYGGALTVGDEATYAARFSNNSNKGVVIGYDTTNNVGHIGSVNPAVAWTDLVLNKNGGNLGLGVTPSASNLSGFIEGGYGTFGQTTSLGTSIAGNAYYNSGWKYKLSSSATLQLQDSGGFKWHTAPSGTAGNAITFTQAMTLDASGDLLVGSSSSVTGRLQAFAANNSSIAISAISQNSGDVGQEVFTCRKFDNNSTTSQVFQRFTINNGAAGCGQINANGANSAAFGSFSDERLKENIVDLDPQLPSILALRPVEFDYIESEGGGHQIGFIAQNMQTVYPDAVGERSDGMLTVTGWSKTEARLVKAIQELKAELDSVKAELAALKAKA